jgi:hypothetical protein
MENRKVALARFSNVRREGVVDSTMCKERLGSPRMERRRFLRQAAAAGVAAGASTFSGASAGND